MNRILLAAALLCALPAWANPDTNTNTNTEWVAAEVVKLDPARSKITLKHARIESIKMAAMTMPFKVKDATLLAPLKVGDTVRFQVVAHDDGLMVHAIERRP